MISKALLGCMLIGIGGLAQAAQWVVGAGSSVNFGDAAVQLSCADFKVDGAAAANDSVLSGIALLHIGEGGELLGEQGQWSLSGDFVRLGSFSAGNSTISIDDACPSSISRVSGGTVFNHLLVSSDTGKTIELATDQTTTVQGQLTLQGTADHLLKLRSTAAGTPAPLFATELQSVQFVDVADNRAIGAVIAFGAPSQYQSVANGNVFRWFQFDAQGNDQGDGSGSVDIRNVPLTSASGMALLSALLSLAVVAHLRRQRPQRLAPPHSQP